MGSDRGQNDMKRRPGVHAYERDERFSGAYLTKSVQLAAALMVHSIPLFFPASG